MQGRSRDCEGSERVRGRGLGGGGVNSAATTDVVVAGDRAVPADLYLYVI